MREHALPCGITLLIVSVAACDSRQPTGAANDEPLRAADTFFANVTAHCGEAFGGQVVVDEPPPEDDPFTGKPLVMHVRECSEDELRIPFHVGDDHSRTWVLTRTGNGLRLKHDHRHEDGTDDIITWYGGASTGPGTEARQEFPADDESVDLFEREGLTASLNNVWAMEVEPGARFVYELARPATGRLFRVEFDLTAPVATPPPPW